MRSAVFLTVAITLLTTASAAREDSTSVVPRVTGSNLKQAIVRLHRAGLHVTIPSSFYLASNSTPEVVTQKPKPGATAATGAAIELGLSQPPTVAPYATTNEIRVPAVKGLSLSRAVDRIEHAGARFWTVNYAPPLEDVNVRSLYGAYRVTGVHPATGTTFRQRRQGNGGNQIVPVALRVRTLTR